jgi:hypothetical protein
MADFCLRVATDNLAFDRLVIVQFTMLGSSHEFDVGNEHVKMCHAWEYVRVDHKTVGHAVVFITSFS